MALLPPGPLNGGHSAYTADDIKTLLINVGGILLVAAGTVAAIFIVLGAFQYLTAYGSEEKAENGKKTLTWAIIGLVFVILARLLLGEIWTFLSGSAPTFLF